MALSRLEAGAMTFSLSTLSLMAMIALGLSVLATGYAIAGTGPRRRRVIDVGQPIALDETLREVLEQQAEQIAHLEQMARALNATDKRQQQLIQGAVRRVALFRYDAFEDVGGRLSFSCAMLDDHRTGVVLTSINGRQETRVYAKPITEGRSSYNLSLEEEEAIRQALAAPEPTAKRTAEKPKSEKPEHAPEPKPEKRERKPEQKPEQKMEAR
jgi:hypothetical protein